MGEECSELQCFRTSGLTDSMNMTMNLSTSLSMNSRLSMSMSLSGFPGGISGKESTCQSTRHETRIQSFGQEDPLEEEMAIHSSTLAWKIPWTEEPGRLQSMGVTETP